MRCGVERVGKAATLVALWPSYPKKFLERRIQRAPSGWASLRKTETSPKYTAAGLSRAEAGDTLPSWEEAWDSGGDGGGRGARNGGAARARGSAQWGPARMLCLGDPGPRSP